jgi:peptide/nickel transport system permease protein
MASFVLKRLVSAIPVLIVVAVISFMLIHLTPGDPAAAILGGEATTEQLDALRQTLGLDQPLPLQMARWFWRMLQGDLGQSIYMRMPVTQAILDRIEPTAMLSVMSIIIAVGLGIPFGIIAAVRHNSWVDHLLSVLAQIGLSVPNFWLGLGMIMLFAVKLGWLPSSGYVSLSQNPLETVKYLLMPAFTLGFSSSALIARLTRSSMMEVLRQDFIRTAQAKGLPQRRVIYKHALRNAMIPTLTVIGLVLAGLAGGAVVTEVVFTLPGAGRLMIQSVARRDYPIIQAAVLFSAVVYVFVNIMIDALYAYIDPRVRYE